LLIIDDNYFSLSLTHSLSIPIPPKKEVCGFFIIVVVLMASFGSVGKESINNLLAISAAACCIRHVNGKQYTFDLVLFSNFTSLTSLFNHGIKRRTKTSNYRNESMFEGRPTDCRSETTDLILFTHSLVHSFMSRIIIIIIRSVLTTTQGTPTPQSATKYCFTHQEQQQQQQQQQQKVLLTFRSAYQPTASLSKL